ncbi:MAG: phosphate/phosphite/phosphonate ABC transporter substrate-binding protein [Bacteroidota bacterium]|nr:phosphate/phosphite/phosphonate ABC transporter substrate-binding protein [uncultured Allomuricauda sp.]
MKKYTYFLLFSILLFAACSGKKDDFSNPEELIVSLSITEDYDKTAGKMEAFQEYLSETLDMPVKLFKVSNGTAVIEAVKAEKTHIGSVGGFSYIVAKSKVDIDPLVTTEAVSKDIKHKYWSNLIVPKNSPLNTIDDLKEKVSELSMAWSYPTSTSGHLVPRGYLKSIGILPEHFKEVMVSENHVASIYSCITEKVDVAAVSNVTLREYTKRGKVTEDDYKIIWSSDPIQRGAIFVSNKVNTELKDKIRNAFTQMHLVSPESAKKIHYQYPYAIKYIAVDDTDFDQLRTIAYEIGLIE